MTVLKDIIEFCEESIQVLRLKRKYIPVLSYHVYIVTSSQTSCCVLHIGFYLPVLALTCYIEEITRLHWASLPLKFH